MKYWSWLLVSLVILTLGASALPTSASAEEWWRWGDGPSLMGDPDGGNEASPTCPSFRVSAPPKGSTTGWWRTWRWTYPSFHEGLWVFRSSVRR